MIIFVGGLIGAGKSTIARKLSEQLGCLYYDADETKREIFSRDPDYEHNMSEGIPFSDETRTKVFDQVIKDLKKLRPGNDHIGLDETLHNRVLRQRLYKAAEEIYGDFLVIWVRADEEVIIRRLTTQKREGHILNDPLAMFLSFRRRFQEFNRSVIVCNNNSDPDDAVRGLVGLLKCASDLAGELNG